MKRPIFIIQTLIFLLISVGCQEVKEHKAKVASQDVYKTKTVRVITGAERLEQYFNKLVGKNVACVVNHTSVVDNKHLVDTLLSLNINIVKAFAPEHGFRGDVPDGEKIEDNIDPTTGIPVISLYGKKRKPTPDDLKDIDVVIFDIQDVGARFYTYLSTMHNIMEACAENNIHCIILDRPNPNGNYIDGPVLEPDQKTFVGMHPVPIVYGMTIGEYALMINGEGWLLNGINCMLEVVQMENYDHNTYYELPIPPSPNLPNQRSILLYPSLCFFEGTTVSIGRGTNKQFQVIGHPVLNDKGYSFIPRPNKGSKYPKNNGVVCYGEDLSSLAVDSLYQQKNINLEWLVNYYTEIYSKDTPFFIESGHFDRIAGTKKLKKQLIDGIAMDSIRQTWHPGIESFKKIRSKYLLYP